SAFSFAGTMETPFEPHGSVPASLGGCQPMHLRRVPKSYNQKAESVPTRRPRTACYLGLQGSLPAKMPPEPERKHSAGRRSDKWTEEPLGQLLLKHHLAQVIGF